MSNNKIQTIMSNAASNTLNALNAQLGNAQQNYAQQSASNALNAANTMSVQQLNYNQQAAMGQQYHTGHKLSIAEREASIVRLEMELAYEKEELGKALYTEAMKGPSPEDLDKWPSLKEAWSNLKLIMKLTGAEK